MTRPPTELVAANRRSGSDWSSSAQSARDPALVAIATFATSLWALRWPSLTQDEISLVLYADLINEGRVPNADFFTPYGPGTFWPLAGVFQLTGDPSILSGRLVGLLYHVVLALGVWSLTRRLGSRIAVIAGIVSGLLGAGLLLIPYGWLAGLSATVFSMVFARRQAWLLSGAMVAVACTVRPEFFLVLLILSVAQIDSFRSGVRALLGFLVAGIPLWIHMWSAGPDLVRNVFQDRVLTDARLPLASTPIDVRLGLVLVVGGVCCLVINALSTRQRDDVAIALLSIGILPQLFQRTDREHLLFVAIVILPLSFAVVVRRLADAFGGILPLVILKHGVAAICVATTLIGLMTFVYAPQGDRLSIDDRTILTSRRESSQEIKLVVSAIKSEVLNDDAIFIGSEDMSRSAVTPTYLYFLLPELVPEAYYLELAPGVAEREESRLLDDVESANVLILSRFSTAQREVLFPKLARGSTRVNDLVTKEFCLVREVAFIAIHRRCVAG